MIDNKIMLVKIFFYLNYIVYVFKKITNHENYKSNEKVFMLFGLIIVTIILCIIEIQWNFLIKILSMILLLSLLISNIKKFKIGWTIVVVTFSISINYILLFISNIITYSINYKYSIKNDFINLLIISCIHLMLLFLLFSIKRIKKGISFLNEKKYDENIEIIILNLCMYILFSFIIFSNTSNIEISKNLFLGFIFISIIIFIIIQKSIELYYKQKLLIQDLNETKKELEDKEKEIQILEQENLNFSKKSHSLAHKQKVLEHKINKLLLKTECAEEFDLKDRVEDISKELLEGAECGYIDKTGISNIDDMLETMQEECRKNNIEFNVQIYGNIFKMVNNYIEKDDLEILLADHIKDAIIAVNHSDNINRSILVKLGKIDNCYGIYFYDSGVEFDKKVLENLGQKPITTYSNEGGTGMGFMNTFDNLRKYNASLKINHLGKPCKENFTKIIMIKFDKNANFCLTN